MTTKTCPFCAEEIQPAAIVCKHCRRDLMRVPAAPLVVRVDQNWGGLLLWGLGIVAALILLGSLGR